MFLPPLYLFFSYEMASRAWAEDQFSVVGVSKFSLFGHHHWKLQQKPRLPGPAVAEGIRLLRLPSWITLEELAFLRLGNAAAVLKPSLILK